MMNIAKIFPLIFFLLSASISKSSACDSSSFRLVSVAGTGPFTITTELCIGGGATGLVRGADADTYDIAFGFFRAAGPINILSYNPAFITSTATSCRMDGFDIGATPSPFFTQATIYYAWDPFTYPLCTNGFQCITSTPLCGNSGTLCLPVTFVTDVLPDSVIVYGIEGAGNPIAGCYSDPDMGFSLIPLPLKWYNVNGVAENMQSALIQWTTVFEKDVLFFEVEKAIPSQNQHLGWATVSRVEATNLATGSKYELRDINYNGSESYYRIRQQNSDGSANFSNVIKVASIRQKEEVWIFPNPARNLVRVKATNFKTASLIDCWGRTLQSALPNTAGLCQFSITHLPPGMYFVKIFSTTGQTQLHKLIIE